MFDGVHLGHAFLLSCLKAEAAGRGLRPAVFTFPAHPLSVIRPEAAPKLLSTPAEKLQLLREQGIAMADIGFMPFNDELRRLTAEEFIAMLHKRYRVDFILRGFNNRFGTERSLSPDDYRLIAARQGVELLDATDFRHTSTGSDLTVSSSEIRRYLLDGDIATANLMLGHTYNIYGRVEDGKKLGRTIGFPTANIRPLHDDKLIPADGVYICSALTGGRLYRAMVNIGTRPTVDGINMRHTIEAHLLDFDGDLYGKELTLSFYSRIRSEIRFDSLESLRRQLESDRRAAAKFSF